MPRDGAGVYTLPAVYNVTDGDVSSANQITTPFEDLQADANAVRPVVAGGTGASTASGARTNLDVYSKAEVDAAIFDGYLTGLELSNNATDATNDIDIATGSASHDGSPSGIIDLSSALTKQIDAAWAVGTNQGGLDTGSIANTTYFVWLIRRSDTGVVDALFSASPTSPTMPTNYDQKRRIGAFIRSGGAILAFSQNGDDFTLGTYPDAHTGGASGQTFSSATNIAMTVPVGIKVKAKVGITFFANSGSYVRLSDPDQADVAVSNSNYDCLSFGAGGASGTGGAGIHREVWTNTSGQVRFAATEPSTTWYIKTIGWVDRRGKA